MRDAMTMIALVFAMILCLVLGLAVVGVVAIPARREGRDVLTPRGEDVVNRAKERTAAVAASRGRAPRRPTEADTLLPAMLPATVEDQAREAS